jgi:hypothetical protein
MSGSKPEPAVSRQEGDKSAVSWTAPRIVVIPMADAEHSVGVGPDGATAPS